MSEYNPLIINSVKLGISIFLLIITFTIFMNYNVLIYLTVLIIYLSISSLCLIYVFNIAYLSIIFIIIYVGAIMVLFLFIIIMFNLKNKRNYINITFNTELSKQFHMIIIFGILIKLYYHINIILTILLANNIYFSNFMLYQYSSVRILLQFFNKDVYVFSTLLYTQYGIILLIIALVMLISMFGSLFLILQGHRTRFLTKLKN
jgi:NADH:ubiquinone oxidoreductase subunit 6 (subunit J)